MAENINYKILLNSVVDHTKAYGLDVNNRIKNLFLHYNLGCVEEFMLNRRFSTGTWGTLSTGITLLGIPEGIFDRFINYYNLIKNKTAGDGTSIQTKLNECSPLDSEINYVRKVLNTHLENQFTMITSEISTIVQNIRLQQEMGEDYKKKPEESQDAWKSRRKKYYESNITGGDYGYMRNMLINTKLIKKAFGIDSGGIESINIYESIESMFSLLNNKITYWDFKLVSDEVDTYRLKIIDNANTWIDFGKDSGLETFKSKFLRNNLVGKPGIFEFPVWKHNSIVKGQELQASIPTSMQLAAMYGSNTDTLKSFSKSW